MLLKLQPQPAWLLTVGASCTNTTQVFYANWNDWQGRKKWNGKTMNKLIKSGVGNSKIKVLLQDLKYILTA